MGSTLTIILIALLLGLVPLSVGVIIGHWWPLGSRKQRASPPTESDARPEPVDAGELQMFACRLHELVTGVVHDVGRHRSSIHRLNEELRSLKGTSSAPLTEIILRSVARVIEINEGLRDRLAASEKKLHEQTQQIHTHIAEARTDPLTCLPNRRAFDDQLARQVAEWRRKEIPFCLLMVDLDGFKAINDRYGHPEGDQLLREVADALRQTVRDMDLLARFGGEEFAVILPITRLDAAQKVAERARRTVAARPIRIDEVELRLTVSLGIAEVLQGDDAASIVQRADAALYASKRDGRNCSHYHDGQTCIRVVHDEDSQEAPASCAVSHGAGESPVSDPDLAAVCDDLRRRLAEITGRPGP